MKRQRSAIHRAHTAPHLTLGTIFLSMLAFFIVVPFVYLIISSFKDLGQFAATNLKTMWLPWPLHPQNYVRAITQYNLLTYVRNSILLAVIQTSTSVFISAVVAYGFARFKFPLQGILFLILLGTLMLPNEVTFIPLYNLFRKLRWTNTFLPLIVPGLFGSAWSVFLVRQMMINVPREIDEAAWIDGAGTWRTFRQIVLPQVKPAIVVAALFSFLWSWKDFIGPLIYINDPKLYTLPIGLMFFESPTEKDWTTQLAALALALVPTVLIYVFGQRYLERGINVTDLK
jgi:multiple sugar transport system permease protein